MILIMTMNWIMFWFFFSRKLLHWISKCGKHRKEKLSQREINDLSNEILTYSQKVANRYKRFSPRNTNRQVPTFFSRMPFMINWPCFVFTSSLCILKYMGISLFKYVMQFDDSHNLDNDYRKWEIVPFILMVIAGRDVSN